MSGRAEEHLKCSAYPDETLKSKWFVLKCVHLLRKFL